MRGSGGPDAAGRRHVRAEGVAGAGAAAGTAGCGVGAAERSAQDIGMLLGEARAHGITALDAIRDALTEKPSLPPLPALA